MEDVRGETRGRTFTDADILQAITAARVDVIAEVGEFDADVVIVAASGPEEDDVTIGTLAMLATATRAAHLLEGGFPEQNPYGEPAASHSSRLYARWRDRMARLSQWVDASTDTPADPDVFSGSVGLALPIHRITAT